MTHNRYRARLVVAGLLIFLVQTAVAQAGMQPASGSSSRSSTSITGGNRSGAAAGSGGAGLTVVPVDFAKLRLGPGFMVSLNVLDDADFGGTFRVDQLGQIAVPILGTLYVTGETVSDARAQIRQVLLDRQILKDPQVILAVVEYTAPEVTIIGEVASPGKYPLLAPRKLLDVLALAGGTTIAAGSEVQITRASADAEQVLVHYSRVSNPKTVADTIVRPGDTVNVERAGIVYVLGAVARPGGYIMQEEGRLNVLQAISMASGTTPLASTATIYLLRRNADGSLLYIPVPYKKMTHGKSGEVQLQAKDLLYVPTSVIKSIYADTQSLLNSAAVASIYIGLGQ